LRRRELASNEIIRCSSNMETLSTSTRSATRRAHEHKGGGNSSFVVETPLFQGGFARSRALKPDTGGPCLTRTVILICPPHGCDVMCAQCAVARLAGRGARATAGEAGGVAAVGASGAVRAAEGAAAVLRRVGGRGRDSGGGGGGGGRAEEHGGHGGGCVFLHRMEKWTRGGFCRGQTDSASTCGFAGSKSVFAAAGAPLLSKGEPLARETASKADENDSLST